MRIISCLIILFLATLTISAQALENNLKGLTQVKIVISDDQGIIPAALKQKMLTESKIKLMSTGLKTANESDDAPVLELKANYIQSALSEHRILVQLRLKEKVTAERKNKVKLEAVTYFEQELYVSRELPNSIYSKFMDKMILSFIEKYLSENKK